MMFVNQYPEVNEYRVKRSEPGNATPSSDMKRIKFEHARSIRYCSKLANEARVDDDISRHYEM